MTVIKQPNGTYHVEFQFLGDRVHRSARTRNRQEALGFEARLRQELLEVGNHGRPIRRQSMTLGEATRRYYADHLAPQARREKSLQAEQYLLERLCVLLGGPDTPLEDVDSSRVSSLRSWLLEQGRAPATVNRYLASLRAVLRKADLEWGIETAHPVIRLSRLDNARTRALSFEEEDRLMLALEQRPWISDLVTFLLGTGARLGEALGLDWTDVDLSVCRVTFFVTKNGDQRCIPLPPFVTVLLVRMSRSALGGGAVFRGPYGTPYKRPHGAFRSACERAGIEDLRIHDLRHTYATRLVQRGVSLYKVGKLLGHRDVRMTQRYAHLNVEDLAADVEVLEGR